MKQQGVHGLEVKNSVLLKHIVSMGIVLSPYTCFYQFLHSVSLAASVDLPPSFVLAIIPEKSIWTMSNVYDYDGCGLMPSQEDCLSCLQKSENLLDVFYLALHLSFLVSGKEFSWWGLQARQPLPVPLDKEVEIMATTFLPLLSRKNATPPLQVFLPMIDFVLQRSILLPKEKKNLEHSSDTRAMIPVVDLIHSEINDNSNVILKKYEAQDVRRLLAKDRFLGASQFLQQRHKGCCWSLQTNTFIAKNSYLKISRKR